ncbi:hypothetical protein PRZ48_014342 [Zasmidium cellare]|uniref:Heterokaryon incompatibility domain-containing protein n=1 Tax=Zasmidium cellare TaxID=395010 RepID=A0ABR0E0N1_ZASCE|nr:hypothetical protein PRZ48_015291 [Zasmidium cellare]KAK4494986.1 hypothetical protein PRZ48_014342 [Zasmidium cellare]
MSMKPDYTPLDATKQQIRLLRVHPGSPYDNDDTVQCDMFVADLQDPELEYDALSYCWGDPNPQQTILVHNREVEIGPSLESALRHLRYPDCELIIWADALCIDQSNTAEKNHQVGQMGLVYSGAQTVHVWLGEGRFKKEIPYDLLRQWRKLVMMDAEPSTSDEIASEIGPLDDIPALVEACRTAEAATIVGIYCSQYWKRTWVFQEIALAKHAVVHYGHHQVVLGQLVQWKDEFKTISRQYLRPQFDRRGVVDFELTSAIGGNEMKKNAGKLLRHTYRTSDMRDTELSLSLLGSDMHEMLRILENLHFRPNSTDCLAFKIAKALYRHAATDPRDKVYGISGFFNGKLTRTCELIEADYTKSLEAVWTDFARYLVEENSAFGILQLSGWDSAVQPQEFLLPSWVPKWMAAAAEQGPILRMLPKDEKLVVESACSDRTSLWVRGKWVDQIDKKLTLPNSLGTELKTLEGRPGGDFLTDFPPGCHLPDGTPRLRGLLFLLTELTSDLDIDGLEGIALFSLVDEVITTSDHSETDVKSMRQLLISDVKSDDMAAEDFEVDVKASDDTWINRVTNFWRLRLEGSCVFMTKSGKLGIGSCKIQSGDCVYLLEPDDAPFVLSALTDQDGHTRRYANVGHCPGLDYSNTAMSHQAATVWVKTTPQRSWIETCLSHEKMRRFRNSTSALGLLRPWCLFDYGVGLPAKRREYTDIEIR